MNTASKSTLKAASGRHHYSISVHHLLCPSWQGNWIWGGFDGVFLRLSLSSRCWLYLGALSRLYSQGIVYNTQSPGTALRTWWLCRKWATWADCPQDSGLWGCGDPGRSSCPWRAAAQERAVGRRWGRREENILILPLFLPTWLYFKLQ